MSQCRNGRVGLSVFAWVFALFFAQSQSAWSANASLAIPTMRIVPGLEEPLVATGATSESENKALDAAIAAYRETPADFAEQAAPLVSFLAVYPASAWRTAVLTDLALGYHRAGYTLKALSLLEDAWTAGRNVAAGAPGRALADRTVGELVRLHTNLGHAERAEALLKEVDARPVSGGATEAVTAAREGVWLMRNVLSSMQS